MTGKNYTAHAAEISAIESRYVLSSQGPVALTVRGQNGGLDFANNRLKFGRRYRVKQGFAANRSGKMVDDQEAYFLGYYSFPYVGGLRLHFEALDGFQFTLEFEGDAPSAPDVLNRMGNPSRYFVVVDDKSARAKALAEARVAIENLAKTAKAQRDAEHEAARPPHDRKLDAAIEEFSLPVLVAYQFVNGLTDTLDFAHLDFGGEYHVTKTIMASSSKVLEAGQDLRFVGAFLGESLILWFETKDGRLLEVAFVHDASQATKTLRHFADPKAHLRPVPNDISKRSKELATARAVLRDLRNSKPRT